MENLDPLQIWLLMAAVAYIAFMAGRATANRGDMAERAERELRAREQADALFASLSPTVQEEVDALLQSGKTIEAIRKVREHSGAGLRESQLAIDARKAGTGLR